MPLTQLHSEVKQIENLRKTKNGCFFIDSMNLASFHCIHVSRSKVATYNREFPFPIHILMMHIEMGSSFMDLDAAYSDKVTNEQCAMKAQAW